MSFHAADFERELDQALRRHSKGSPQNLVESIHYSLLSPGKRIRPRLMHATAEVVGLKATAVLPAAIAIEMIHCFTLIHDDLPCMDDDDLRRGLPTNHKKFGEALALLAGDALIPLAVSTFLDAAPSVRPEHLQAGLKRLLAASGAPGVIGGQAAELLLREGSSLSDLKTVFAGKTGALFEASVMVPADLAGVASDGASGSALLKFSQELGLAFQVADDLEDQGSAWEPDHILYYVSREKAADQTARGLRSAADALSSVWGAHAQPLVRISEEVLSKLGQAGRGGG